MEPVEDMCDAGPYGQRSPKRTCEDALPVVAEGVVVRGNRGLDGARGDSSVAQSDTDALTEEAVRSGGIAHKNDTGDSETVEWTEPVNGMPLDLECLDV